MRNRSYIIKLFSVIAAIFFLAANTGITIIIHDCPVCHDFYVRSGIFITPSEPEDDCCEAAENHFSAENSITVEGVCCHFTISNLRLDNYSASFNYSIPSLIAVLAFNDTFSRIEIPDQPVIILREFHNKHGGRFISTYKHQLNS